ncbi:sigma-54 dependent transcriptional regulator [Fusobacterium sp.]|uniref:sigma-54-dependent transcriptional regulator n=1 Tax=Fusobacterium sp. TaxID=68766 RepID=UPI002622F319|nr:sigma-54 dependent transcriptional regulator [Fusobacterium sp.]
MDRIIVIDNEISICSLLTFALEKFYDVQATTDLEMGLDIIRKESINLILLDSKIINETRMDILEEIKKINKDILIMMMTNSDLILSVEDIKKGIYSYLTKPINLEEVYMVIKQALEFQKMNEKIEYFGKELKSNYQHKGMIGKTTEMQKVYSLIEKLKDVDTGVLITGESGTGKELVAKAIHFSGKRKNHKFVEINCAAIPDSLLEEEFFGYKKGTFTNAINDKVGKFQYADKGTIFLDEIGDMSLNLQSKLLRVLQEKSIVPLGSNKIVNTDVRIISATNKDLKKLVDEGKFRKDLYFRLNVIEINLPPLRERKEDIPLLIKYFLNYYNKEMRKTVKWIDKEVEKILMDYEYPGNIRELSNIIECGVLLSQKDLISLECLPSRLQEVIKEENRENSFIVEGKDLTKLTLREAEKILIKVCLDKNDGHKRKTAEMLGISERGLRNKIIEYELEK